MNFGFFEFLGRLKCLNDLGIASIEPTSLFVNIIVIEYSSFAEFEIAFFLHKEIEDIKLILLGGLIRTVGNNDIVPLRQLSTVHRLTKIN